jgi:exopolyphosphatase/guanosine-5'-triphosphate,3'-diphosphate pyrophosphatase
MVGNGAIVKATPSKPKPKTKTKPKLGLRAWMERVLLECDRAAAGLDLDPVHDLRVALRRCRSLADGLMAIDPDSSWKAMKKAGRKLFQALGELRDMQVMEEWIEKLSGTKPTSDRAALDFSAGSLSLNGLSSDNHSSDNHSFGDLSLRDSVVVKLLAYLHGREAECKQHAFKDLNQFDRKQWRQWSRTLPQRASRVRPGSVVYLHLALEKWTAAYELHKHALRTRSQVSWHELRIGIKRFRYTVENFLPRQHALWGDDLKELQDLLGEVHDLDVLWATAVSPEVSAFPDVESRTRWRALLNAERTKRIERYRNKMVGKDSLWRLWRAELPAGPQLRSAAMSRLRTWAGYVDPDFAHSLRVAQLALLLYDGLKDAGLLAQEPVELHVASKSRLHVALSNRERDPRAVLQASALMHDVGKATGAENHQKSSYRMIRALARPLGWSARELELAAVVARYHRGALPHPRGKTMQALELADRPIAIELAAVLRLANALDVGHGNNGGENSARLEVRLQDRSVVVRAEGYSALDRSAEGIAAARHLLETVLRRPVLVRALRSSVGNSKFVARA